MNWLSQKLHSVRFIIGISLVLLASLSNNLAGAQQICADLFEGPSLETAFQEMNQASNTFFGKFDKPQELSPPQLEQLVRSIETQTENYLTAAGISFEAITQKRPTPELSAHPDYVLEYKIYELTGNQTGTSLSRLLYGAQMHPVVNKAKLSFGLDPLYLINYFSTAHFLPEHRIILIGPHEFAGNITAISADLRHEIQHFFEQMKMEKGENTLARFEFESLFGRPDQPYSDKFRADEIETHLRDIRFLTKAVHQKDDTKMIAAGYSPELIPGIHETRQGSLNGKKEYLQHFSNQLRIGITEIETQLANGKIWYKRNFNAKTGDLILSFYKSGYYGDVKVNLNGLVKEADLSDRAKLQEAVLEVLKWSKVRLDTIDRELQRLESRN